MGKGSTEASCYTDTLIRFHETNQNYSAYVWGEHKYMRTHSIVHVRSESSSRVVVLSVQCE